MNVGTIYLGRTDILPIVNQYILEHPEIKKVYVIGDTIEKINHNEVECATYSDIIEYKYYYKFLQEINNTSLVILNQILHSTNRYLLHYNCIRRYVQQTNHRLIFNDLPARQSEEDFMILYDMIQVNPFLKDNYNYITHFEDVVINDCCINLTVDTVELTEKELKKYEEEKEKAIQSVKKDPDIIPRRLLKYSESCNKKHNKKEYDTKKDFKLDMNICVNNSKVDIYYYNEILKFQEVIQNVCKKIQY